MSVAMRLAAASVAEKIVTVFVACLATCLAVRPAVTHCEFSGCFNGFPRPSWRFLG